MIFHQSLAFRCIFPASASDTHPSNLETDGNNSGGRDLWGIAGRENGIREGAGGDEGGDEGGERGRGRGGDKFE